MSTDNDITTALAALDAAYRAAADAAAATEEPKQ